MFVNPTLNNKNNIKLARVSLLKIYIHARFYKYTKFIQINKRQYKRVEAVDEKKCRKEKMIHATTIITKLNSYRDDIHKNIYRHPIKEKRYNQNASITGEWLKTTKATTTTTITNTIH